MVDLTSVGSGAVAKVSSYGPTILKVVGWLVFGIIFIGAAVFGIFWWLEKKRFNKKITYFELVNGYYTPSGHDLARSVKLGSGGFEVIYLRKLKTYKLSYGSRIGKDSYYYFIMPDGYWYNGLLSGQVTKDGIISIITTSPLARAQYTALEKYIDNLYSAKKSWWNEYGQIVVTIGFILIMGIFVWLVLKQFSSITGGMTEIISKEGELIDRVNTLLANTKNIGGTALVPV